MKTLYFEFPETYREINRVLEKFTNKNYFDDPDTIDHYIEMLVRMETHRRLYSADIGALKKWMRSEIIRWPVSDDYFSNNTVQLYIIESSDLWAAIDKEMTITPNPDFIMWHVERGVWKMITSGVNLYVK
ncbi:hypothetical protein pEaSNUABM10_00031 [Erwinia phage pEa_SNUABM_10]|nr:hypothetical protein pEaSNUABM10_00031 [Erwinia phage pEa_SNUABM_10]